MGVAIEPGWKKGEMIPASFPAGRANGLAGVFSTGRSGSTWLGALVSSHPDVAYRFEPILRPRGQARRTREAIELLHAPGISDADLSSIREGLLVSDTFSDKPPFRSGTWRRTLLNAVKVPAWAVCRTFPALSPPYRRWFTPNRGLVVFKMVAHEATFARLRVQTRIPLVYLVRHPAAMVASLLEGQRRGLMPSGRASVIRQFLADNAPALAARYSDRVDAMDAHEHEALLWRWSVEACIGEAAPSGRAVHVVFYENLCRSTRDEVERTLRFLSLELTAGVERFIEETTRPSRRGIREIGIHRYFSVFRDPTKSVDRWRKTITREQQADIVSLVEESPVYRMGRERARWI